MRALRFLRQSPILAATAIASLALGIGANVTVFTAVREMVLDTVTAVEPERLASIDARVSFDRYRELRAAGVFQDLACQGGLRDAIWSAHGGSELVWIFSTSANFFQVLGVGAAEGRVYTQADEGRDYAVVSHSFWRRRLHGSASALEINGRWHTVSGVLPADYRSVMGHGVAPEIYLARSDEGFTCQPFGRLQAGLTRAQTRPILEAAAARIAGPQFARELATLRPMAGFSAAAASTGDERRFFLFFAMLFAAAALLAVIAAANVAGLIVARHQSRRREFAVRQALGASRWDLMRPMLAEGLVLTALGGAAALVLDAVLRAQLRGLHWSSAYHIPIEFHFQSGFAPVLYALATAAVALTISAVVPALRSSRADVALALKESEPALSLHRWSLRNGFVLVEVVLAMLLLTLGALFTRSFLALAHTPAGFDTDHTIVAAIHGFRGDRDALARRLAAQPGVLAATSIGTLPFMGELPLASVRRADAPREDARTVYSLGAGENFFRTLAIPLLRGRDFELRDRERSPTPVVLSRSLALRLFGENDPVGAQLALDDKRLEIVGVAAVTRMRTLGDSRAEAIYTPYFAPQFLLRVSGIPALRIEPLRAALSPAAPEAALDLRPLSDAVAGALFPMRMAAMLVGALSMLGMLLAVVGLYASMAYAVGRRRHEIGIRTALGATRGRIVRLALADSAVLVAIGTIAGMALAMAAIRPLADLLPDGLDPWDPRPFAAAATLLIATAVLASCVPARRAAQIDPARALRREI